jgi:hypothetical protein
MSILEVDTNGRNFALQIHSLNAFKIASHLIQTLSRVSRLGKYLQGHSSASNSCCSGMYRGTQLDGLSAGDTIRLNGYIPCLTELYRAYHCSSSTFHHGRSINLATANAEIGICPILCLNVYQSLRAVIRLARRPLRLSRTSRCAVSSALDQRPRRRALRAL